MGAVDRLLTALLLVTLRTTCFTPISATPLTCSVVCVCHTLMKSYLLTDLLNVVIKYNMTSELNFQVQDSKEDKNTSRALHKSTSAPDHITAVLLTSYNNR